MEKYLWGSDKTQPLFLFVFYLRANQSPRRIGRVRGQGRAHINDVLVAGQLQAGALEGPKRASWRGWGPTFPLPLWAGTAPSKGLRARFRLIPGCGGDLLVRRGAP